LKRTRGLPTESDLKIAQIAALFHDLGKINPNFQLKLQGIKTVGYSSHAYLSSFAWFCFARKNETKLKD
jgi:CRISPR-associated endonuclease/helicase Cas3